MGFITKIITKIIPIRRDELAKFLSISLTALAITYILNVLRISKDALVISQCGVEIISAIKLWLVLPCSLLFMLVYIKLTDKLSRTVLFHTVVWFFAGYFVLFALLIYPNRDRLVIEFSETIIHNFPNLKYAFKMISYWHLCSFFVVAELAVVALISISFWQLMNHITTIEDSKRLYPSIGFVAQFGLMLAGYLSKYFSTHSASWDVTLNKTIVSIVVASGLISLGVILITKFVGKEHVNSYTNNLKRADQSTVKRKKMSIKESLKYIGSSKTILIITVLLLCYNITLNLSEGVWKKSIEVLFNGSDNRIHLFMANVNFYRSLINLGLAILGIQIVRMCSWRTAALLVPIMLSIFGGAFFLFLFFRDSALVQTIGLPSLALAVYFGTAQNTFTKVTKNALFDPTKEMMYLALEDSLKVKGKAAAETIGTRLGKGMGSLIQQVLLSIFTGYSLLDLTPAIAVMFGILMVYWIYSINRFDAENLIDHKPKTERT